jgi:hypothetical protein
MAGKKMSEDKDNKLKPIVLSAVKAIMRAHLEDMKKQGLLFKGPIMDIDIDSGFESLNFKVSKEFIEFLEANIKKGSFQNGLSSKIVIILEGDDINAEKKEERKI